MKTTKFLILIFTILSYNLYSQSNKLTKEELKNQEKVLVDKYKSQQKGKKIKRKQIDGSIIDELHFEDINGNKYTSESLKGKVVVFNFWFIQCKPCVKEFPDLNELKSDFKSKTVEFFAVSWNDKESIEQFLKTTKLDYTVVPNGNKIIDRFQVPHYPYHIIIDQNGRVEYINEVLSFNVINKIKRKVKSLL